MKNKIEKLLSYYLKFFEYVQSNGLTVIIDQDLENGVFIPKNIQIEVIIIEDSIYLGFSDKDYYERICCDFWELLKTYDNNPQKAFISWYNTEVLSTHKEYKIDLTKILQD